MSTLQMNERNGRTVMERELTRVFLSILWKIDLDKLSIFKVHFSLIILCKLLQAYSTF